MAGKTAVEFLQLGDESRNVFGLVIGGDEVNYAHTQEFISKFASCNGVFLVVLMFHYV